MHTPACSFSFVTCPLFSCALTSQDWFQTQTANSWRSDALAVTPSTIFAVRPSTIFALDFCTM